MPSDAVTPEMIAKLPRWAQSHIRGLTNTIDRQSRELDRRTAEVEEPWLVVDELAFHGGPYPLAGRHDRHVTIRMPNGDTLDVDRPVDAVAGRHSYVSLRAERSLVIQPQSGNVVKIATADFL